MLSHPVIRVDATHPCLTTTVRRQKEGRMPTTKMAKLAINPLPWILSQASGFQNTVANSERALSELAPLGYRALSLNVPEDADEETLQEQLERFDFTVGPGYYSAHFDDTSQIAAQNDAVRNAAELHARWGVGEMFIASDLNDDRRARPAQHSADDVDRTSVIAERLGQLADIAATFGVTAALHPHVGSWVENEDEIRQVLTEARGSALRFGPDVGHIQWAGGDPAALIRDFRDIVVCTHIKDVHGAHADKAREAGANYATATQTFDVWAEPGRGDVDFDGVFQALGTDFTGWCVVEVDVPSLPTPRESSEAALSFLVGNGFSADPRQVV